MKKRDSKENRKKQDKAFSYFSDKTYRDLKKEAIELGMSFPDATAAGIQELISYIEPRIGDKKKSGIVEAYDDWADNQLALLGYPEGKHIRSPQLRLSYIGELDENRKPVRLERKEKKVKEKRERDENGLYKGTKKSYTYGLAEKGYSLDRVTRRVIKKFPDAKEKSIVIWYRNALKGKK